MPDVETKEMHCIVCAAAIIVDMLDSDRPEVPELMRPPPDAWYGFTRTDDERTEIVLCCGQDCARSLSLEGLQGAVEPAPSSEDAAEPQSHENGSSA
jgi:hypothetical protein